MSAILNRIILTRILMSAILNCITLTRVLMNAILNYITLNSAIRFMTFLACAFYCFPGVVRAGDHAFGPTRQNPALIRGADISDGKLGSFLQLLSGDCFFLASLVALAEDVDGESLIFSAIHETKAGHEWRVAFPNQTNAPVVVDRRDIAEYRLLNIGGNGRVPPVTGDIDVQILEIAADKIWKMTRVKPQGLWDDIPMNAMFMFSDSAQTLIWNRSRTSSLAVGDIEKHHRIPPGIVRDVLIGSSKDAERELKHLIRFDADGITMVLIDYKRYHAVAITDLNFYDRTYGYIDSVMNTLNNPLSGNLDHLLEGMANGEYAINYLEIDDPVDYDFSNF